MSSHELERFIEAWELESKNTARLLESLPEGCYDVRAFKDGRSVGEMAWHLAEIDAYMTAGVEAGRFDFDAKPPNMTRPREIKALAPGYRTVHADALARVRKLAPADLDRDVPFFDGKPVKVRDILWGALLHHSLHHRGQLVMMARMAGGKPPGIYGPTLEQTQAMKAQRS